MSPRCRCCSHSLLLGEDECPHCGQKRRPTRSENIIQAILLLPVIAMMVFGAVCLIVSYTSGQAQKDSRTSGGRLPDLTPLFEASIPKLALMCENAVKNNKRSDLVFSDSYLTGPLLALIQRSDSVRAVDFYWPAYNSTMWSSLLDDPEEALTNSLIPQTAAQLRCVVWIVATEIRDYTYTDGITIPREAFDVWLIDVITKRVTGRTCFGGQPPSTKRRTDIFTATVYKGAVRKWLNSLPVKRSSGLEPEDQDSSNQPSEGTR